MKTIGFFGDSFCASNQPESWCNILQEKLGANRIRWFGKPGNSIWSVFFQFNSDSLIFVATDAHKLVKYERKDYNSQNKQAHHRQGSLLSANSLIHFHSTQVFVVPIGSG